MRLADERDQYIMFITANDLVTDSTTEKVLSFKIMPLILHDYILYSNNLEIPLVPMLSILQFFV